ncbi:hypothetical protein IU487_31495 [Nocardia puris]|uniref:Uncharacterized protein n=1 Tax=Nocardia puris TaxID=208602 RepID=A0A366D785_9NOCA|nr:hypothetical protein [Nocardia puris]MBF6215522.1 hypothetical protein [Nocardia puris]RBO85314.1 hypothetical protein DFR74_115162 [Nocardia puris]
MSTPSASTTMRAASRDEVTAALRQYLSLHELARYAESPQHADTFAAQARQLADTYDRNPQWRELIAALNLWRGHAHLAETVLDALNGDPDAAESIRHSLHVTGELTGLRPTPTDDASLDAARWRPPPTVATEADSGPDVRGSVLDRLFGPDPAALAPPGRIDQIVDRIDDILTTEHPAAASEPGAMADPERSAPVQAELASASQARRLSALRELRDLAAAHTRQSRQLVPDPRRPDHLGVEPATVRAHVETLELLNTDLRAAAHHAYAAGATPAEVDLARRAGLAEVPWSALSEQLTPTASPPHPGASTVAARTDPPPPPPSTAAAIEAALPASTSTLDTAVDPEPPEVEIPGSGFGAEL